jgi:3-(3-hydroxy-phenyl)propionate hydroxylase
MNQAFEADVAVVGAGPVGVICALALARRGISVVLVEAELQVNASPRAATTHPATLEMLAQLDLVDDVVAEGVLARYFQFWDRPTGQKVAEFDHQVLHKDTAYPFVVQCEQHKIANMGLDRLTAMPNVRILMGTRLVNLVDNEDRVHLTLAGPGDVAIAVNAGFLAGCDGGRSFVRKQLEIPFEGFTHPERFIVISTPFDFEAERGYCYRNYFSDPDEWANLFKVSGEDGKGLWRVVFPTRIDETDDAALSGPAVEARLQKFFPFHRSYEVTHRTLYKVHQRVATSFRKGRVLLAGDSAHVNNPIGGLGMNFGIHDAVELAEILHSVLSGTAGYDEIDRYDRERRPLNVEFVQTQTIQNKKRLEEKSPETRRQNFHDLATTAADPVRHRAFLMRTSLLESVRKSRITAGRRAAGQSGAL